MITEKQDVSAAKQENLKQGRYRLRIVIPAFPAFNVYSSFAKVMTALGPICIASSANTRQLWDVEVIDENNFRLNSLKTRDGFPDHERLQTLRPADVVGLYGGLTSTIPRLYEVAEAYKNMEALTIAGGPHFADETYDETFDNNVDYVISGEGEYTVDEFLEAFEKNESPHNITGLVYRTNGELVKTGERDPITEFEKLPLPDLGLLRGAKLKWFPITWTRGCGSDCEFCTVKGKVRSCGPARVMEQISSYAEAYGARQFFFVDDFFGPNRREAMEVCGLLENYQKETGMTFELSIQMRLERAKDTELLRAMRRASVSAVAIGFESPIREELQAMNKKLKPEQMVEWARAFRREGFFVHGMFIFGYPLPEGVEFNMSIEERIERFREFIKQAKIDTLQVLLPVPLPGTALKERLDEQGRVFPQAKVGWEFYDGNFPLFQPDPPITVEEMQEANKKIMTGFYRFKYMISMGLNLLWFPSILFYFHKIQSGWRNWYRVWRNHLYRFAGSIIILKWKSQYKRGGFRQKLLEAERAVTENRSQHHQSEQQQAEKQQTEPQQAEQEDQQGDRQQNAS